MKRIVVLLTVLLVALLFSGCAQGISQEKYDEKENALIQCETDKATLTEEKETLTTKVEELGNQLAELPHNPTSAELMGFLAEDKTEEGNYDSHITYTLLFLKEAAAKKIQGYPVVVTLITGRVLVFAGFETTDKGWVYILPALDVQVNLEVGKSYREINGGTSPFGPHYDAILSIMIFGGEFLNEETTAEAIEKQTEEPLATCD
jgi:hypothetical protein